MKVWVSTFGLYSNGYLIGYWVDAKDAPATVSEFKGYLIGHGDELPNNFDNVVGDELWCFDTEGFPPGTGELNPAEARQWASVAELVEDNQEAFIAYCDNIFPGKMPSEDYVSSFEEAYAGRYDSWLDFAERWFSEMENIPEHIERYIDYNVVARDLEGDFWSSDADGYKVDIFRNL